MSGTNVENYDALVKQYGKILNDKEERLSVRFRALFSLKNLNGKDAINQIGLCFDDTSELLKHELAYCLGQMGSKDALDLLKSVLENHNQEPVVRHEAAEAIGAIGCEKFEEWMETLEANDPDIEVRETAHLAHRRIKFFKEYMGEKYKFNDFGSVDPTPPSDEKDISKLTEAMMDNSQSLWERYRAMFSLRDLSKNDKAAVMALVEGFKEKESALFRHEIAFVLGQVGPDAACAESDLIKVVEDDNEHPMVRHEAAEALGSIDTENANNILKQFASSKCRIVRESCEVALDQAEYYNDPTQFQPISV